MGDSNITANSIHRSVEDAGRQPAYHGKQIVMSDTGGSSGSGGGGGGGGDGADGAVTVAVVPAVVVLRTRIRYISRSKPLMPTSIN